MIDLDDDEKMIMEMLGKLDISQNKNDEGLRVAHFLWKKRQEKTYDFRIVKRG